MLQNLASFKFPNSYKSSQKVGNFFFNTIPKLSIAMKILHSFKKTKSEKFTITANERKLTTSGS